MRIAFSLNFQLTYPCFWKKKKKNYQIERLRHRDFPAARTAKFQLSITMSLRQHERYLLFPSLLKVTKVISVIISISSSSVTLKWGTTLSQPLLQTLGFGGFFCLNEAFPVANLPIAKTVWASWFSTVSEELNNQCRVPRNACSRGKQQQKPCTGSLQKHLWQQPEHSAKLSTEPGLHVPPNCLLLSQIQSPCVKEHSSVWFYTD